MQENAAPHPQFSTTSRFTGMGLALCSMSSAQIGASLAVPLMLASNSLHLSTLILVCDAILGLVIFRPRFKRFSARQWCAAASLGLAMAVMLLCYYVTVTLIPVGAAITLDSLGPLTVAILALKGWPRVVLPALAGFGVLVMSYSPHGWLFAPVGILFALAAGTGWACYIVLMRHVGRLFSAQDGLCLSFLMAALFALPVAFCLTPTTGWLQHLPDIFGLAILSTFAPFLLELTALRKLEMGTFSMLMSLEPAIGTLAAFIVLGQTLALQQLGGVLAVILASAGAVLLAQTAA